MQPHHMHHTLHHIKHQHHTHCHTKENHAFGKGQVWVVTGKAPKQEGEQQVGQFGVSEG